MFSDNISTLAQQFPNNGELVWIGLRPARKQSMVSLKEICLDTENGMEGDHYSGRSSKRQVTLFQWEYLAVLESLIGKTITPNLIRRNLLIRGINLYALKKQTFQIGTASFRTTGLCHPCSRMETELGKGAYNAMRNHGGITTQIIHSGHIKLGDALTVLKQEDS